MLCTASSHSVFDLCRRPFYGCARRLLFVHKETPGTRLPPPEVYKSHILNGTINKLYITWIMLELLAQIKKILRYAMW